jgi:hypothetical protein
MMQSALVVAAVAYLLVVALTAAALVFAVARYALRLMYAAVTALIGLVQYTVHTVRWTPRRIARE